MKTISCDKYLTRGFITGICLLLMSALVMHETAACGSDYAIWMIRSNTADPLYRFIRDNKAGYIDRNGKVVIEPQFTSVFNHGGEFHNGLMLTSSYDGKYVDASGKYAFENWHKAGSEFSEGLAVAADQDGKKWGYIDTTGSFAINPRFDSIPSSFSEGLARIDLDNRFGYIDRSGQIVIPPMFVYGGDFHDGRAWVITEGPCAYVTRDPCSIPVVLPADSPHPDQAPPCKYGFIDRSGALISADRYDEAMDFSEGLAAVRVDKKWGYIGRKGKILIDPKFDVVGSFSEGLALVRVGKKKVGYINHTGAFAIAPEFDYADSFSEGLAVAGDFDRWNQAFYYIDKQGKRAISEEFALASHFYKGLAHVKLKSIKTEQGDSRQKVTFAYIDVTGKRVFTY